MNGRDAIAEARRNIAHPDHAANVAALANLDAYGARCRPVVCHAYTDSPWVRKARSHAACSAGGDK